MKNSARPAKSAAVGGGGVVPCGDGSVGSTTALAVGGAGAVLARDVLSMNGNLFPASSSVWESMLPYLSKELSPGGQYDVATDDVRDAVVGGRRLNRVEGEEDRRGGNDSSTTVPIAVDATPRSSTQLAASKAKGRNKYVPAPPVSRPEAPIADEIEVGMLRDRVLLSSAVVSTAAPINIASKSVAQETATEVRGDRTENSSFSRVSSTSSEPDRVRSSKPMQKGSPGGTEGLTDRSGRQSTALPAPPPTTVHHGESVGQQAAAGMFKGEAMTQGVFVVNTVALDNIQRTGAPLPGSALTNPKLLKKPNVVASQNLATNPKKRKGPVAERNKKSSGKGVVGFAGVELSTAPAPPSDLPVTFPHPVVVGSVTYVSPKFTTTGPASAQQSGGRESSAVGGGSQSSLPFRTNPIPVTSPEMNDENNATAQGGSVSTVVGGSAAGELPQPQGVPMSATPASAYFYGFSRPHAIPSGPHTSSLPVPIPLHPSMQQNAANNTPGTPSSTSLLTPGFRGGGGGGAASATISVPGVMAHMANPTTVMLVSSATNDQRSEAKRNIRGAAVEVPPPSGRDAVPPTSPSTQTTTPVASNLQRPTFAGETTADAPGSRLQPRPPIRNSNVDNDNVMGVSVDVGSGVGCRREGGMCQMANEQWRQMSAALPPMKSNGGNGDLADTALDNVSDLSARVQHLRATLLASEVATMDTPRALDRYNTAMRQYEETRKVMLDAVRENQDEAALLLNERARADSERAVLQSRVSLLTGTIRLLDIDHSRRHEAQQLEHTIVLDRLREELETLEEDRERVLQLLADKKEVLSATAEADTALIRLTRQYEKDERELAGQLTEERERLAKTMTGKLQRTFTEMAALASRQQSDREVRAAQDASRLAAELRDIEHTNNGLNKRLTALKNSLITTERNISLEKQRHDMLRTKNTQLSRRVGQVVDELRALEGLVSPSSAHGVPLPPVVMPPSSPRLGAGVGSRVRVPIPTRPQLSHTTPAPVAPLSAPSDRRASGGMHPKKPSMPPPPLSSLIAVASQNDALVEARRLARDVDDERHVVRGIREHLQLLSTQMARVQKEIHDTKGALVRRLSFADEPIVPANVKDALIGFYGNGGGGNVAGPQGISRDASLSQSEVSRQESGNLHANEGDPDLEEQVLAAKQSLHSTLPAHQGVATAEGTAGTPKDGPHNVEYSSTESRPNEQVLRALLPVAAIAQAAVEELTAHYIETSRLQRQIRKVATNSTTTATVSVAQRKGQNPTSSPSTSLGLVPSQIRPPPLSWTSPESTALVTAESVEAHSLSIEGTSPTGNGDKKKQRARGAHSVPSEHLTSPSNVPHPPLCSLSSSPNANRELPKLLPLLSSSMTMFDPFSAPSTSLGIHDAGTVPPLYGKEIELLGEHADPHEKRMMIDFMSARINRKMSALYPVALPFGSTAAVTKRTQQVEVPEVGATTVHN